MERMSFRIGVLIIGLLLTVACNKKEKQIELQTGVWRGVIEMQQEQLPFNFEIQKQGTNYTALLRNAEETFTLDEVQLEGDSLFMKLHIFDIDLRARILGDSLRGLYIKNYKENYRLPFTASFNDDWRFNKPSSTTLFEGKWQLNFTEEDGKVYPAVGIFKQAGPIMKGTFLTETGDYRYLEGVADSEGMHLYTFDGNHAFIFKAHVEHDSIITGTFLSGLDYIAQFEGLKNENAQLTDADELTFLKEGYDKIEFSFPNLQGKLVSPDDEPYQNKVLLLQIFGTWCPNCMDETKFYADWYRKNKDRGVAIVGLAYEAKDDFDYAKARVEKMKEKYNVGYDFVIAGEYDKEAAAKTLPMLNHVLSFPTTIFIDKKGEVRKIHTGFSGPATGSYYTDYVKEFNAFMEQLISE